MGPYAPEPRRSGGPLEASADQNGATNIHLAVEDLWVRRGTRSVFEGLSCRFERGKISVVLGSSGSGKSTLFRVFCCLLRPDAGHVWLDGHTDLTTLREREAKQVRRQIGMMFQGGALLDSLPIFDNVALPLREHTRMTEGEVANEVHRIFEAVGLKDVDRLLPGELSGGMMKRAALARALIMNPQILLCDEPFSGLDPATVRLVESLLMSVNERFGITIVLTSHHIGSTLRMGDWAVLLSECRAISGPPRELHASQDPRARVFFADQPVYGYSPEGGTRPT